MARVLHFDIPAEDPVRAAAFYQKAFGWTAHKWDGPMDYWMLKTGPDDEPGIDGGLMKRESADDRVHNTIGVESLDLSVAAVQEAGGQVLMARHAIPGVGWYAHCMDTEGNPFGIMQLDPSAA